MRMGQGGKVYKKKDSSRRKRGRKRCKRAGRKFPSSNYISMGGIRPEGGAGARIGKGREDKKK